MLYLYSYIIVSLASKLGGRPVGRKEEFLKIARVMKKEICTNMSRIQNSIKKFPN